MIKAEMNNLLVRCLSFTSLDEETALKKRLTFKVPNYFFSRAYRRGVWDGSFTFYNGYTKSFPTGLFFNFPDEIKQNFIMIDSRKIPIVPRSTVVKLRGVELRDYQAALVREAVRTSRCIVLAPTNAGKTEVAAGIISLLPCKTLWLTHRGNLMVQTRDRLKGRLGKSIGMLYGSVCDLQNITIAMVQTLNNRLATNSPVRSTFLKFLASVDMLIIDECHHTSANTWYNIARKCKAYYRFGLSATPLVGDAINDNKLISQTGATLRSVTNLEMVERGFSAKPTIFRVTYPSGEAEAYRDYLEAYRFGVELNSSRNAVVGAICRQHVVAREPTLVLVNTIRHAEALRPLVPDAVFVNGATSYMDRVEILKKLSSGAVSVVVATPIFDEGADVPNVRVVVLAGAGKSFVRVLQQIGRGMRRKSGGENTVSIYDFVDTGSSYLTAHANRRLQFFKKEGFEIKEINWRSLNA
jgi:superfamily II DNA or RNA helicase